jgi:hypothetical protein
MIPLGDGLRGLPLHRTTDCSLNGAVGAKLYGDAALSCHMEPHQNIAWQ